MTESNECSFFDNIASRISRFAGRSSVFIAALSIVIIWAVSGPIFGFSETWQLVINTGTTIITFLLLFIVQNTQNRDAEAMHLKLDAIILVMSECDNELMKAEELGEEELQKLIAQYKKKGAPKAGKRHLLARSSRRSTTKH